MEKKRVSTRLTIDEYHFISDQARVAKLSLSEYLKKKLLEPQQKMSQRQVDQVTANFSDRVDVFVLARIERGLNDLNQKYQQGQILLTVESHQCLLKMQHSLNKIEEEVDILCRPFM